MMFFGKYIKYVGIRDISVITHHYIILYHLF